MEKNRLICGRVRVEPAVQNPRYSLVRIIDLGSCFRGMHTRESTEGSPAVGDGFGSAFITVDHPRRHYPGAIYRSIFPFIRTHAEIDRPNKTQYESSAFSGSAEPLVLNGVVLGRSGTGKSVLKRDSTSNSMILAHGLALAEVRLR
jgi:hypothetical protein